LNISVIIYSCILNHLRHLKKLASYFVVNEIICAGF